MLVGLPDTRRRDLVRLSLHFWQQGEAEILAPHRRASRAAYERAITAVLGEIEGPTTMDGLIRSYVVERRRIAFVTERACRAASMWRPLSRVWVRDAAYWRRLCREMGSPATG